METSIQEYRQAVSVIKDAILHSQYRAAKLVTGDMSLYKQYQQNADFKSQMRNVLVRMVNTLESAPEEKILREVGFTLKAHNN